MSLFIILYLWFFFICGIAFFFFTKLALFYLFEYCSVCLYLIMMTMAALLREFNHEEVLHRQFGQSTTLISEISAYFREPKFVAQSNDVGNECLHYLDKFPLMKDIYLKYNCIFQSEADIERVFSYAGGLLICLFNLLFIFVSSHSHFFLLFGCGFICCFSRKCINKDIWKSTKLRRRLIYFSISFPIGMIMRPNRRLMSDEMFEMLLMLNVNNEEWDNKIDLQRCILMLNQQSVQRVFRIFFRDFFEWFFMKRKIKNIQCVFQKLNELFNCFFVFSEFPWIFALIFSFIIHFWFFFLFFNFEFNWEFRMIFVAKLMILFVIFFNEKKIDIISSDRVLIFPFFEFDDL